MFWFISKTIGALLVPMTWIVLANLLALICLWRGWRKTAILLLLFTPLFLLSLKAFTIPARLSAALEYQHPALTEIPAEARGMIILGGASETFSTPGPMVALNWAGERIAMAHYARVVQPELPIVLTGASRTVFSRHKSEAERVHDMLKALYPNAGPIYVDPVSLNTAQHPIKLKDVVADWQTGPWLLVTSAMHMPRSVAVFEKQGWQIIPMPTDYRTNHLDPNRTNHDLLWNLNLFSNAIHEWFGLAIYKLTGKT